MNQYIVFGISICFISWMVGIIVHAMIKNSHVYHKLSDLNFIKSDMVNKAIGLPLFAWCVKNTFFKWFNQKIKVEKKLDYKQLTELRLEMKVAEIGHLIAFVFVMFFAIYKGMIYGPLFALTITLFNLLLNLYPVLLQQYNKRRLDRVIRLSMRHENMKGKAQA